jgi:dihydrofolate synthase/folylpolyglutamate synthase
LDGVKFLFKKLNIDNLDGIVIHVGGTNGKGSTCAMLESIYRGAGYSTGLCTSPHLLRINERIQFNREEISDKDFVKLFKIVNKVVQHIHAHNPTIKISFFEYEIAMALLYFKEKKPNVIILEVGLGGRLDATNATRTDISVLTSISFDHEDMLGETISSIAREKAGIIRRENKVIVGRNLPSEAMLEIEKIVDEKSATMVIAKDLLPITLTPRYQNHNASIAHRVAKELTDKLMLSEEQIINGILTFKWAARWQIFDLNNDEKLDKIEKKRKNKVIIDGAHNEAGAIAIADEITTIYGQNKPIVIFASNYVSRASRMLKILASISLKIYLTKSMHDLCLSQDELVKCFPIDSNCEYEYIASDRIMDIVLSDINQNNIVITGSLYLAGDIIKQFLSIGLKSTLT